MPSRSAVFGMNPSAGAASALVSTVRLADRPSEVSRDGAVGSTREVRSWLP